MSPFSLNKLNLVKTAVSRCMSTEHINQKKNEESYGPRQDDWIICIICRNCRWCDHTWWTYCFWKISQIVRDLSERNKSLSPFPRFVSLHLQYFGRTLWDTCITDGVNLWMTRDPNARCTYLATSEWLVCRMPDRCNAADGPVCLRCSALFWGGLPPLRCCVAPWKVLYYSSLSHSHRLRGGTVGGKRKKGGVTVKIGLERPSLLHWFFSDANKVLVYIHSIQECVWLTSVKVSKYKTSHKYNHTSHKCFGSAICYACISSKVHVSTGKTWISPTANSSSNPPPTLKLDHMASRASWNSASSFSCSSRVALSWGDSLS